MITQRFNPLHQGSEILYWLMDTLDTVKDLPYDVGLVVRELRRGKIKIEFEHIGLEPIRETMERVSNRMALTIIIAALLVSSSVVTMAKVNPYVGTIPVLAFFGYVIAGILSLILIFSIIRK